MQWKAGSGGQRLQPCYDISRESPSERSEHSPVICRPTEETSIEDLSDLTDLKTAGTQLISSREVCGDSKGY